MKPSFDSNLYTQIGLDSGSLTMLGSIVHTLGEPGDYRVAVHHGESVVAVCVVTADKGSPVAQETVNLASLAGTADGTEGSVAATSDVEDCGCASGKGGSGGRHFTVNPRGYVLFNVSGGSGGYYVHVRRIDADAKERGYDSRMLIDGDLFSAIVLRPGTYSVSNTLTHASGQIVVSYPKIGDKAYVPPPPVRVVCGPKSLEPANIEVQPGQGILFEVKAATRIAIELQKADDGPHGAGKRGRAGWTAAPRQ